MSGSPRHPTFQHSALGVYIVVSFTIIIFLLDSYQSVIDKYHGVKRWWWFTAALGFFAYLYVRPYIRVSLGSASRGYINFSSCYIAWLCGAVFYHLPSLKSMGIDIRTDLSMFIVVFLGTFVALSGLWGLHAAAVRVRLLQPKISPVPGAHAREMLSMLLLNSANLALACSVYHSVCGNGLMGEATGDASTSAPAATTAAGRLRAGVCSKWLHPVPIEQYPKLSAWMLMGEGFTSNAASPEQALSATTAAARHNMSSAWSGNDSGWIVIDYPLDGQGAVPVPAGAVLSPVLTLWITLMLVYIANAVVDHAAASCLLAEHMGELRNTVQGTTTSLSSIFKRYRQRSQRERHTDRQERDGDSSSSLTPRTSYRAGGGGGTGGGGGAGGGTRGKGSRQRGHLEVKKTISKAPASLSATAAAWGRHVIKFPAMQTLVRDTRWLWGKVHHSRSSISEWMHHLMNSRLPSSNGAMHTAADSMHSSPAPGYDSESWSRGVGSSWGPVPKPPMALGGGVATAADVPQPTSATEPQPGFLPMVPCKAAFSPCHRDEVRGPFMVWGVLSDLGQCISEDFPDHEGAAHFITMARYSGTSADLLKTCFDLIVSVKFFLGRFDMRTMQAATAASIPSFNEMPLEGDGFTYEHYDSKEELWLDFIADTGDGGNSTYTVAAGCAAQQLSVQVPEELQGQLPGGSVQPATTAVGAAYDSGSAQAAAHRSTSATGTASAISKTGLLSQLKPPLPKSSQQLRFSDGRKPAQVAGASVDTAAATVEADAPHADASTAQQPQLGGPPQLVLPRAEVLLIGGDLAYPNPTKETYEQRLFKPFQDAFPPPPHYHPERLVVHKPDLPPMYGVQEAALPGGLRGLSPRASRHASATALRAYPGANCFAIPGNHDWIDGLETFINYIQHKGWLGGWLLPQEKSYFSLKLPHGWWLFGLDLALTHDIDMCQLRYFANVVEQRLSPDDNVIIMTHQPVWLLEWFWLDPCSPHLRQLIRGHLRGRARVHLAGDLHFYMRHSFTPPMPAGQGPAAGAAGNTAARATAATGSSYASASITTRTGQTAQASSTAQMNGHSLHPTQLAKGQLNGHAQQQHNQTSLQTQQCVRSAVAQQGSSAISAGPTEVDDLPTRLPTFSDLPQVSMLHQQPMPTQQASVPHQQPLPSPPQQLSAPPTPVPSPPPMGAVPHSAGLQAGLLPASMLLDSSNQVTGMMHSQQEPELQNLNASGASRPVLQHSNTLPRQRSSTSGLPVLQSFPSDSDVGLVQEKHSALSEGGQHASSRTMGARTWHPGPFLVNQSTGSGGGLVGGSSDEESESSFSTVSGRSGSRRSARERSARPVGLKAFGKQLPALCVQDLNLWNHPAMAAHQGSMQPLSNPLLGTTGLCEACQARARERRYSTFDPEHLICNGAGGAFMHPTHVFAPAAFYPPSDLGAETTAALYSAAQLPCTCRIYPHDVGAAWGSGQAGFNSGWFASTQARSAHNANTTATATSSLQQQHKAVSQSKATSGGTGAAAGQQGLGVQQGGTASGQGQYICQSVYPSPERSLQLGKQNLHLFRLKNTRFDVIGGVLYYLLVISIIPRCSKPGLLGTALLTHAAGLPATATTDSASMGQHTASSEGINFGQASQFVGGVAGILDADTTWRMLVAMVAAYLDALYAIVMDSYISLAVCLFLCAVCVGLARSGGVGAVKEEVLRQQAQAGPGCKQQAGHFFTNHSYPQPRLPVRVGGVLMQLAWGSAHALAHISCAVVLVLLLELGVEMCIRHEQLGREGMHSLYRWYLAFEAEHFPDPQGIRTMLQHVTLGLYPGLLKAAMAIFDIPEAVAVTRIAVCDAAGSLATVSRVQALAYYGGMLAYFWLLATPVVGAVFGLYLYISAVWGGVHYDEAYSSIRVADHKCITRMHITPDGDLELYTLAVDHVPVSWREDPQWRTAAGGGNPSLPSYAARFPSRWVPATSSGDGSGRADGHAGDKGGKGLGGRPGERQSEGKAQRSHLVGESESEGAGRGTGRRARGKGQQGSGAEEAGIDWRLVDYLRVPRKRVQA